MKKTLAALLSLMLLCTAAFAMAEEPEAVQIDLTYEGEYVQLGEYDLMLFMPSGWHAVELTEEDGLYITIANEDETHFMMVGENDIAEDFTAKAIAAAAEAAGYTDVVPLLINESLYVTYTTEENDIFGAYLISEGQATTLNFMFSPIDAEFVALATQMMASVTELVVD